MKTFRSHEKIPAVALTYAGRTDAFQPIILKSQESNISPWVITTVSVSTVRDWSISRAVIMLTAKIDDTKLLPKLPDLSVIRGGKYPYLMEEDEIRLYAGYVGSSDTIIDKNLLDEHPFDVETISGSTESYQIKSDPSKPLCPIFWGFIDQVRYSLNSQGLKCVIECRDRMRVLHDTKMITLGSHQTSNRTSDTSVEALAASSKGVRESATGIFPNIIIEAANTAAGQGIGYSATILSNGDGTNFNGCWKPIVGGKMPIYMRKNDYAFPDSLYDNAYYVDPVQLSEEGDSDVFVLNQERLGALTVYPWIDNENPQYFTENYPDDPTLWIKNAAMRKINPYNIPRFHIWSERAPLVAQAGDNVYQVTNQSPAGMIVELSGIETLPTDVYASHVNGDFIYGPRIIDMSGFNDPNRNFRTYFAMTWDPKIFTVCPLEAQRIIEMDVVSTTLGVFNSLYVLDGQSGGVYHDFIDKLVLFIKSTSPEFEPVEDVDSFYGAGRIVNPPCKNTVLVDGNLTSFSTDNAVKAAAALGVAMNYARIWSRQINTIQFEIPGDPTFYPNEAVQVYNTGLHDEGISIPFQSQSGAIDQILNSIRSVVSPDNIDDQIQAIEDESMKDLISTAINNITTSLDDGDKPESLRNIGNSLRDLLKEAKSKSIPTSISKGNLPIYQVRALEHKIVTSGRNPGFTTKIEAIASL